MILGIDPGLANLGWAVLQSRTETGNRKPEIGIKLVACGVIKTKNGDGEAKRLGYIYQELEKLIKKYKVEAVAIETLFFARNTSSALPVAEAIGVIKVCGVRCGLEVFGYTPLQVKMALVGYGRAEKDQVEVMVKSALGIEGEIKPSHASDAVAVGLTHLFTMRV